MGVIGNCHSCDELLLYTCVGLGMSPLCESYIGEDALNKMESFITLKVKVCSIL